MDIRGIVRLGAVVLILSFCMGFGFIAGVMAYKPADPLPFCQAMEYPLR